MHRVPTLDRVRRVGQVGVLLLVLCSLSMPKTARAADDDEGFVIIERALEDGVEQAYVKYPSGDLSVTGWLFVNPFSENDVEPCIVFNHGGVDGVGEGTRAKCRWLAKQGYIVFAPSYRGEDGSEGNVEVAAGEVDDVLAALALLRDHPGIVPHQFALVGTSHGALVSMMAAARPEARGEIQAVVAGYGVMDIYAWYQHLLDNHFDVSDSLSVAVYGSGPKDKPKAFAARHALDLVPNLAPAPILLVAGEKDEIVPASQAKTMLEALHKAGRVQDELHTYPDGGHGFLFWDDPKLHSKTELDQAEKAWTDILDFLARHLQRLEPDAG